MTWKLLKFPVERSLAIVLGRLSDDPFMLYVLLQFNSTSLLSCPTGDASFPTLASGGEARVRANVYLRSRFYQGSAFSTQKRIDKKTIEIIRISSTGFATVNGKRLARTDIEPEAEEDEGEGGGKIIFHEVRNTALN